MEKKKETKIDPSLLLLLVLFFMMSLRRSRLPNDRQQSAANDSRYRRAEQKQHYVNLSAVVCAYNNIYIYIYCTVHIYIYIHMYSNA